jgi:hypothetical protein
VIDRNLRGQQPLRPDELGEPGDADDRELRAAMDAGRALGSSIDDVPVRVSGDFTSRVMATIASEPVPGPVGFMTPLRRRGVLAGFVESVRQAWAAVGSAGMPSFARATALAYVLMVAIAGAALTGATAVGVGSALGVFDPARTPAPTMTPAPAVTPAPTPDVPLPTPGPQTPPVETEELDESDDHSGPDKSDDHGGSEPSDDQGNSGPGSSDDDSGSDDHSGSGSGSDETPRPSDTPEPSETPH